MAGKRLLPTLLLLCSLPVVAQPAVYFCTIFTQLPDAPESPIFRFEVEGEHATLTYTYRVSPAADAREFFLELDVLNDSERSLVLGSLTEGNEQHAPRYDVWVLDKRDMYLSSEVTRANDANMGRSARRSGTCVIED
jgi:hypothetical protein